MPRSLAHLFVYGTLREGAGHALARRLASRARAVRPAEVAGRLFDLGPYPGLRPRAGRRAPRVHGDLVQLAEVGRNELLADLDAYEGCPRPGQGPGLFQRVEALARCEGSKSVSCWVYVYARPIEGAREVRSGDWLAHVRAREAPPRPSGTTREGKR